MDTYVKLMGSTVEMKELFFHYLESRIMHCRISLLRATEDEHLLIRSSPDGLFWEGGHFGYYAYRSMMRILALHDKDWKQIQADNHFDMCLNQVVKEIHRINGPHDHFLAFFELYTCNTWNNRSK